MSASAIANTLCSSFGCMGIGYIVHGHLLTTDAARKGVATLYAKLVFPCMVFVGVADIDAATVDRSLVTVILASKLALALVVAVPFVAFKVLEVVSSVAVPALAALAAIVGKKSAPRTEVGPA